MCATPAGAVPLMPRNRRTLKVYYKSFASGRKYVRRPEIRLAGKWLQALGFSEGQQVQVSVEAGRITITNRE